MTISVCFVTVTTEELDDIDIGSDSRKLTSRSVFSLMGSFRSALTESSFALLSAPNFHGTIYGLFVGLLRESKPETCLRLAVFALEPCRSHRCFS